MKDNEIVIGQGGTLARTDPEPRAALGQWRRYDGICPRVPPDGADRVFRDEGADWTHSGGALEL